MTQMSPITQRPNPLLALQDADSSRYSWLTECPTQSAAAATGKSEVSSNLTTKGVTELLPEVTLTSITGSKSSENVNHTPQDYLAVPSDLRKSSSLPNRSARKLSSDLQQGGSIFLNHQRKKNSIDDSMLSQRSEEVAFLPRRDRSPSPAIKDDETSTYTKKPDLCDCVVEEILLTEQQYVNDLEDIVMGYLEYSKRCSHITENEVAGIFGNIEKIYNFHSSFLNQLEECKEEPVAIAKCFIDRGTEFEIYARYVTNYPCSIECLSRVLKRSLVNEAYRKQQLILGHGLPLGSYLHKPVQRILKYHLLLQNLLKYFPEETLGRQTITASLQCMTDCALNINELKRSHEHAMRVQEIQSTLYNLEGHNLLDFGPLVIDGELRMHGARSLRHVYLFEKGVVICKKREDGAMSCRTIIMCDNLMLVESIPREPLSFHLIPFDVSRSQNTFQAKTLEQKREWCNLVKKCLLESLHIPEKARELLLTLTGKSESDEKLAKQFKAVFSLKAHQAPDYIERKRRKSQPYFSSTLDGYRRPTRNNPFSSIGFGKTERWSFRQRGSRRHSLPDVLTPAGVSHTCSEWTSHDEDSSRGRLLRALLSDTCTFNNSIWSPEIANMAKRFKDPLLRRTDSYSQAVRGSPELTTEYSPTHYVDILEHSRNSMSSSTYSFPSHDVSYQDDLMGKELSSDHSPGISTSHRGKTETSAILNKLSQLKERTSSKLTDLLKRTPVKLFKDPGEFSSHSEHSEYGNLTCDSHRAVGRRLSNADAASLINLSAYFGQTQNDISEKEVTHEQSPYNESIHSNSSHISSPQSESPHSSASCDDSPHCSLLFSDSSQALCNGTSQEPDLSNDLLHVDSPRCPSPDSDSSDSSTLHSESSPSDVTSTRSLIPSSGARLLLSSMDQDLLVEHNAKNVELTVARVHNDSIHNNNNQIDKNPEKDGYTGHQIIANNGSTSFGNSTSTHDLFISPAIANDDALEESPAVSPQQCLGDMEESGYDSNGCSDSKPITVMTNAFLLSCEPEPCIQEPGTLTNDTSLLLWNPPKQDSNLSEESNKMESDGDIQMSGESELRIKTSDDILSNAEKDRPPSKFWIALDKYINREEIERPMKPLERINSGGSFNKKKKQKEKSCVLQSNPSSDGSVKSLLGDELETSIPASSKNKVYRMARKYSTRIKSTKPRIVRKSRIMSEQEEEDEESDVVTPRQPDHPRCKRQSYLQSGSGTHELIGESTNQKCDFDSGSECNDIYEQQSMAALESFTSDDEMKNGADEMRDSAVYSDAEDLGVSLLVRHATSICNNSAMQNSVLDTNNAHDDVFLFMKVDDDAEVKHRRCRSLPRSHSLSGFAVTATAVKTNSVDDILSRPVSSSLLLRLKALRSCSQLDKSNVTPTNRHPYVSLHEKELDFSDESTILTVTERQRLLSSGNKLLKQQSSPQLTIKPGLVQQAKQKLHVS